MGDTMAIVSVVVLVAVIVIGFLKKMNVGILAILAATLFGIAMGIDQKEVIEGFGSNLFITLLGITFLCAIAQINGSLELLAKKCVARIGNHTWMAPIVVWLIGIVISGVGPGSIPTLGVMCAIAMPVAYATGYDPIMMGLIGEIGIFCGRFSPVTSDSAVISELAAEQGITGYAIPLFIYAIITSAVCALVIFFAFKGHKVNATSENLSGEDLKFSTEQIATLIGVVVTIILTVVFQWNIGLASFGVIVVLILLGFVDEKQAIKSVPWSVLIMVTGVGILMKLVISAGGIDLITAALGKVMTGRTAPALMGASAAVMSWFSSATGVVFPTMIPTIGGIVEQMNGSVTAHTLLSMICICAAYAGLSPASTGGGLIMATRATDPNFTKEEENKVFIQLFAASAGCLAVIIIMSLIGIYSFMG